MSKRLGLVLIGLAVALAAVVALSAGLAARQQATPAASASPDALMGAAQYLEEVQGKPDAAIAAYKKVLAAPGVSRALAARAQFRIGACYEKLGQADARRAYDAVVRDFADQPELVRQAQARLAALSPVPSAVGDGPIVRHLFSGIGKDLPGDGIVSPDGKSIAFEPWGPDSSLAVRDLATGGVRGLLHGPCTGPVVSSWSGDSRHLSFQCTSPNDKTATEVRALDLAGFPSRLVYSTKNTIHDVALSPDGATTYVLVRDGPTGGRLLAISTTDGTARSLWEGRNTGAGSGMRVSPDGRYVAFETTNADRSLDWDIWAVAAGGGGALPVAQTPLPERLVDWTPDSAGIVVTVAAGSDDSLRLIGFRDATVGGATTLRALLPGLRPSSARITTRGMLAAWAGKSKEELLLAEIDEAAGRLSSSAPVPVAAGGGRYPAWSPDGSSLAYIARHPGSTQSQLVIFTTATRQARTFPVPGSVGGSMRWSPDGRRLTYWVNVSGRTGALFTTNVQSGETSELPNTTGLDAVLTSDGTLAFHSGRTGALVRDLRTGVERQILEGRVNKPALSPDEKWLAATERGANGWRVLLAPSSVGEPKELIRANPGSMLYIYVAWSADSRRVFVVERTRVAMYLWSIPVGGGEPVRIDLGSIDPTAGFAVHSDGKTVALTNFTSEPPEAWALENFLPPAKTAPKAGPVK